MDKRPKVAKERLEVALLDIPSELLNVILSLASAKLLKYRRLCKAFKRVVDKHTTTITIRNNLQKFTSCVTTTFPRLTSVILETVADEPEQSQGRIKLKEAHGIFSFFKKHVNTLTCLYVVQRDKFLRDVGQVGFSSWHSRICVLSNLRCLSLTDVIVNQSLTASLMLCLPKLESLRATFDYALTRDEVSMFTKLKELEYKQMVPVLSSELDYSVLNMLTNLTGLTVKVAWVGNIGGKGEFATNQNVPLLLTNLKELAFPVLPSQLKRLTRLTSLETLMLVVYDVEHNFQNFDSFLTVFTNLNCFSVYRGELHCNPRCMLYKVDHYWYSPARKPQMKLDKTFAIPANLPLSSLDPFQLKCLWIHRDDFTFETAIRYHCNSGPIDLSVLSSMDSLSRLYLDAVGRGVFNLSYANLSCLTQLTDLQYFSPKGYDFLDILHLTNLRTLDVVKEAPERYRMPSNFFSSLSRLTALTRLSFDSYVHGFCEENIRGLMTLTQIMHLSLRGTKINNDNIASIADHLTNIHTLDISSIEHITNDGIIHLTRLTSLLQLSYTEYFDNRLDAPRVLKECNPQLQIIVDRPNVKLYQPAPWDV